MGEDVNSNNKTSYSDESEHPDASMAFNMVKIVAIAAVCGLAVSWSMISDTWFVLSFIALHVIGAVFFVNCTDSSILLIVCATFGLHLGVAISKVMAWMKDQKSGSDAVIPWSVFVIFACLLYLQHFFVECVTLPPDYITGISLFFPIFPAFNLAVVLSCVELFTEWRYFPQFKLFPFVTAIGALFMAYGQFLIARACLTAGRNFWASCREEPNSQEKQNCQEEDFEEAGLEILDRRVIHEGCYKWERHPAYLGSLFWGVGMEVALCNPIMLLLGGFVLWVSLLHISLIEEEKLYEEFGEKYAQYAAVTPCSIPFFNYFLNEAAFHREVNQKIDGGCNNAEDGGENKDYEVKGEEDGGEEGGEEDCYHSEDELFPSWVGVPRGGALWNRQFREPLVFA